MPIFDQGYQHWNGVVGRHAWRWLAITRQGVRTQLRNRKTKYMLFVAWVPALVLVVFLALWGLFEQKSDFIKPFMFLFSWLPEELREGPRAFRGTIWTLAFHFFLSAEVLLSLILTLMVGPDLISQDLRFNAFPLYFSRPLRRFDYFLGKLGIIAAFIGAVTIVPAAIAYVVGVAFSLDLSVLRDTWRVLVASVGYGLVISLVCGLAMLAFSSLSRNSRVVSGMFVALWFLSGMVSNALVMSSRRGAEGEGQAANLKWRVVSFTGNLDRVREGMLDTDGAYDQILRAVMRGMEAAEKAEAMAQAAQGRGGLAGMLLGRGRRPRSGPEHERVDVTIGDTSFSSSDGPERIFDALRSQFPWEWSAGILAGLCGLSLVVLSTRVRSLDRLR